MSSKKTDKYVDMKVEFLQTREKAVQWKYTHNNKTYELWIPKSKMKFDPNIISQVIQVVEWVYKAKMKDLNIDIKDKTIVQVEEDIANFQDSAREAKKALSIGLNGDTVVEKELVLMASDELLEKIITLPEGMEKGVCRDLFQRAIIIEYLIDIKQHLLLMDSDK